MKKVLAPTGVMPRHRWSQRGITLIELLIGIVLGLIVIIAIGTVWVSSNQSYSVQEDLSRNQEAGRYALDLMKYDLRMAGHAGCVSNSLSLEDSALGTVTAGSLQDINGLDLNGDGDSDVSLFIEGRERGGSTWQASDTNWLPSNTTTDLSNNEIWPGTDAITLRYLSSERFPLTAALATVTSNITVSTTNGAPDYKAGEIVGITDCASGEVFAVNSDTTGGTIDPSASLSKLYDYQNNAVSYVSRVVARRYYVGTSTAGNPALMRKTLDSAGNVTTQELIEGVENMQILYGEDTGGMEGPDTYRALPNVANMSRVRAIRIAILVRALNESSSETNSQSYAMLDETIPAANDRRRRQVFQTTVQVRNNRWQF